MTLLPVERGRQNAKCPVFRVLQEAHMDEFYWKPGIAYVVPGIEAVADVGQLRCCDNGWGKVEDCVLPRSGRKRNGMTFCPCPTVVA